MFAPSGSTDADFPFCRLIGYIAPLLRSQRHYLVPDGPKEPSIVANRKTERLLGGIALVLRMD